MTNWLPDLSAFPGPRYQAIAAALAADVAAGRLKPGERLPTHRDLAWNLGVTVGTVSRAYAEAERRGLTSGEVGRGTYVRHAGAAERHIMMRDPAPGADAPINMNFAFPPPGEEARYFGATLAALSREPDVAALLDYQPHAGLLRHRAAGAAWLARSGVEVPPERVVVTGGAQHGIAVCLAAVTQPGDRVLCEALTYPGVQSIARLLGLRFEGVAFDDQGLKPEAVDAACRANEVKALYCVPTCQNPTTAIMPEARRREIAEVAKRHDIAIIEDDIFTLLFDAAPPPVQAFAPEHTYFLTSLSKSVAPGLRVGYATGPARAAERLASAVRATCWMATPLTAEIATRWVLDGSAERILKSRQRESAARRELALDILGKWQPACPPGSIYLWMTLPEPWRSADFALEAQRRGVAVTPAEVCAIGRQTMEYGVKVCLGPPRDRAELADGLQRLATLIESAPADRFAQAL